MKLFLMENSPELRVELVERLSNLMNIEIIGTSDDSDVALSSILKLKPDIVIFDNFTFNEEEREIEISTYGKIKELIPGVKLVIVDRATNTNCCSNGISELVDHCAENYKSLEGIIKGLVSDNNKI